MLQVATDVAAGPRLDRLPIGAMHRRVLALIAAGLFLDAFEVYMTGGVLGALLKGGWSSMSLNAGFVTATFAGMIIGVWAAGILGDRFGRRFSYQINLAVFGLASIAAAFAPSMPWLIAFRAIMGLGLGAELVVAYATLAEFMPAANRGRWVALLALIANSALFFSSVLGLWIIPTFSWRAMFLIVGVGAIIVWFLRKSLPESPRWLEQQGRGPEAEAVLRQFETASARHGPLPPVVATAPAFLAPIPVSALFGPPLLRASLLGMMIHVLQALLLYGLVIWLPSFFIRQGLTIQATLTYTTIMSLGGPVGALIGLLLADRLGRKPVIMGASIATALFAALYPFAGAGTAVIVVGFCMIASIYVFVAVGVALRVAELFPTPIRLRGTGLSNLAGRGAAMGMQFAVIWLFATGGVALVVSAIIVALVVQTVAIGLFDNETRGRSLEALAAAPA